MEQTLIDTKEIRVSDISAWSIASVSNCASSEVYLMDCIAGMKHYPDKFFDLAVVDPPYGYETEKTGILNFRMKAKEKEWNTAPTLEYFTELVRVSKNQIVWGGNYFPCLWELGGRCFIYWHKGNPVNNFADGELAWTSFDRNAKQFDYRYYGNLEGKSSASDKFHPTQKPIALYDWVYQNFSERGQRVLDTHLGSGSSRIAANKAGLDFVGFEIDKDYFNASEDRFKKFVSQTRLF
jgi:site-specific DNA-methyltransferase (adenine-specific)